ncbi:MAG: hypothetical protein M3R24_33275, partial [Chloroflexota bacterium]|nr:hypothetical protein [Chloroflexota bacterium]
EDLHGTAADGRTALKRFMQPTCHGHMCAKIHRADYSTALGLAYVRSQGRWSCGGAPGLLWSAEFRVNATRDERTEFVYRVLIAVYRLTVDDGVG